MKKLKYISKADSSVVQISTDCLLIFIKHNTIQQFFKYNIAKYFELISHILDTLSNNSKHLQYFLDKNVINKNLIASENFLKCFLEILIPTFGKCLTNNDGLFDVFSQIIQKVGTKLAVKIFFLF